MRLFKSLLVTLVCLSSNVNAATFSWSAQISNGLGLANGTDLAVGSLLRAGIFNINNQTIRDNRNNVTFLNANFIQFDTATIGEGVGNIPAHWSKVSSGATDPTFATKPIYLWAFDSPTIGGATEHGIFTSTDPDWIFPSDSPVPGNTTIDLSEVQNNINQIVVGGFGIGTSDNTMDPHFNLAAVPEPAGYGLVCGLLCLAFAVVAKWRTNTGSARFLPRSSQ